jgi:hypothetical protein
LSLACFKRKTKIERQVFHLTLILSFPYNNPVNWTRVRRVFGLLLLSGSLIALVWSFRLIPDQARTLEIASAEMRPVDLPAGLPAIAEQRQLSLEWPPVIRSGETATVRLIFDPSAQESQPAPASPVAGEGYSVLAEARLELSGVPHTPLGEVSQALLPDRPVTFVWDVRPVVAGEAQGTVWLHLRFVPAAGGPELRQVLTAQRIDIRVIDLLGVNGPWARALGSAGLVVGAALCLDGIFLWLWRRLDANKGVS